MRSVVVFGHLQTTRLKRRLPNQMVDSGPRIPLKSPSACGI
jgi:hypothetical protein